VTRPKSLPEFSRPPVDEVIIGVQYLPLAGFTDAHVGLYWREVRDELPTAESHPRLDTPFEQLGPGRPASMPNVFMVAGPQGRTWLKTPSDDELVQIQDDRFLLNWRRRGGEYPRFDSLYPRFAARFALFRELMASEGLEVPIVRQVEVTYINWITDLKLEDFYLPAQASRLDLKGVEPLGEAQFIARYLIEDDSERQVARLQALCGSAMRAESALDVPQPGFQFQLSFKAPSEEPLNDQSIETLALLGRKTIVEAFTALTTPAAHESWGKS
jgi:uncharacterized protein (TIGR04255 family)